MKTIIVPKSGQRGSVLLVSLVITFIIGLTLASYLIMTQSQNASVVRSQTWNASLALSEAGVEDALAMLNQYKETGESLYNWTNAAAACHWDSLTASLFHVRRYVGSNYYDAYITNLNDSPTVFSAGVATWNSPFASAPQNFYAAAGVSANSAPAIRKLEVRTHIDPSFNVAMAAKKTIDFNGKNITTDSFDSADPSYSTWNGIYGYGTYPNQTSKTKALGDVVTDEVIINSLNVGNAKIKGHVKTGPKGTLGIGPNGSVGDRPWVEGNNLGVQTGYYADDMNVLFPDVSLPSTSFVPILLPANWTQNGVTYSYVFSISGDYQIPGTTGSIYVYPNVKVRLRVTDNIQLAGSKDQILIKTDSSGRSGSLTLYMDAPTFSLQGNGVVNESGNAGNFLYLGTTNNTSVNFGGNANFVGAIYAPQADFSLGGGGTSSYDFIGASVSRTVTMNGHFKFHYDENLRRIGMGRGFVPTNWKEVP